MLQKSPAVRTKFKSLGWAILIASTFMWCGFYLARSGSRAGVPTATT